MNFDHPNRLSPDGRFFCAPHGDAFRRRLSQFRLPNTGKAKGSGLSTFLIWNCAVICGAQVIMCPEKGSNELELPLPVAVFIRYSFTHAYCCSIQKTTDFRTESCPIGRLFIKR